jgi:hypothetical protein
MMRWAKSGVLDQVFEALQARQIIQIKIEAVSLDSAIIKVHPDGTGAQEKMVPKPSANPAVAGPTKFIWLPRVIAAQSPLDSPPAKITRRTQDASL